MYLTTAQRYLRTFFAAISLIFLLALPCPLRAAATAPDLTAPGEITKATAQAGAVAAKFDKLEIKTTALPSISVVDLDYEFTNTSDSPLAVEGFVQSCGCMVGEWDGTPVKPGERGKIKAKFLTQGLRGTVRKNLTVKFFESASVELFAEVNITEALVYSAQTLRWVTGEEPKSQQVDIAVNPQTPTRVLSVSGNDPAFACELQTVKDACAYKIIITPRDTKTERICVLQVRTDSKDPRDALHGLFALVGKTKPEGGSL